MYRAASVVHVVRGSASFSNLNNTPGSCLQGPCFNLVTSSRMQLYKFDLHRKSPFIY